MDRKIFNLNNRNKCSNQYPSDYTPRFNIRYSQPKPKGTDSFIDSSHINSSVPVSQNHYNIGSLITSNSFSKYRPPSYTNLYETDNSKIMEESINQKRLKTLEPKLDDTMFNKHQLNNKPTIHSMTPLPSIRDLLSDIPSLSSQPKSQNETSFDRAANSLHNTGPKYYDPRAGSSFRRSLDYGDSHHPLDFKKSMFDSQSLYGLPYNLVNVPYPNQGIMPNIHLSNKPKRHRRKFEEINRIYKCDYSNCTKSYGTLNHLNSHIILQGHGKKRTISEFRHILNQKDNASNPNSAPS